MMHCHLRPLVPPVVLGFNHEAHAFQVYEISAKSGSPRLVAAGTLRASLSKLRTTGETSGGLKMQFIAIDTSPS